LSDDDFAHALMRNPSFRAVVIQETFAANAQARFMAPGRVVNAGMNNPGISRRYFLARLQVSLDQIDFQPFRGERASDRNSNDPGPYNKYICALTVTHWQSP
jgi:hypothetical protein